jgi:hypothetical protein
MMRHPAASPARKAAGVASSRRSLIQGTTNKPWLSYAFGAFWLIDGKTQSDWRMIV